MHSIAGDGYNRLSSSDIDFHSQEFYDSLIRHMINESFSIPTENVLKKLRECMPLYAQRLQDSSHTNIQSLKIAEDVAKSVGFFDIHGAKREDEVRLIFESALVLLLYIGIRKNIYHRPSIRFYNNYRDFEEDYDETTPGYNDPSIDELEQAKLVIFANLMKTILLLVPNPKGKRAHLIDILTRLTEGKHKKYITGTGQSPATLRRVQIYQKESGVQPTARPLRLKDIVPVILDSDLTGDELTEQVVEYIDHNRTAENLEVATYKFNHPTQDGLQVEALELKSANGMSLVRSFSILREADEKLYEVSRSVSLASVLRSASNQTFSGNDIFEEFLSQPLPAAFTRTDQTIEDSNSIVREVSFRRQFESMNPFSDMMNRDYYSWVDDTLATTNSQEHRKLRSISQALNMGSSNGQLGDAADSKSLNFGRGFSQISMRSFSFIAPDANEFESIFPPSSSLASSIPSSIPILEVPSYGIAANGNSNRRSSADIGQPVARPNKIQKKDWDDILDLS
jgi:hypothetical protein